MNIEERLAHYQPNPPSYLSDFLSAKERKRLNKVNRHCGREYTSFPFFKGLSHYSRLAHSIGVSFLLSRYCNDPKVILSGLFHDIATPAFAHVIDFLLGDHRKQEATESKTGVIIQTSSGIQAGLRKFGLKTEDVSDYHLYPLADNDSPRLSADRLEYTLSNRINFNFGTLNDLDNILSDLVILKNEDGIIEMGFMSKKTASFLSQISLKNGHVYTCDEDRYGREYLAHVIRFAIKENVLSMADLYKTEPEVIDKRRNHPLTREKYRSFTRLNKVSKGKEEEPFSYKIPAKKRFIDPYVLNVGRVSSFNPELKKERDEFKSLSFDYYLVNDNSF